MSTGVKTLLGLPFSIETKEWIPDYTTVSWLFELWGANGTTWEPFSLQELIIIHRSWHPCWRSEPQALFFKVQRDEKITLKGGVSLLWTEYLTVVERYCNSLHADGEMWRGGGVHVCLHVCSYMLGTPSMNVEGGGHQRTSQIWGTAREETKKKGGDERYSSCPPWRADASLTLSFQCFIL